MDSGFMIAVHRPISKIEAVPAEPTVATMPVRVSLLRSMSWSFMGNVFEVSCAWAFMTLLVKLGTSTMVGQYGLAMAFLAPIFALASMQMRALQATDARQEFTFGIFFITRLLTLVVGLAVLAGVLVVNREDRFMVLLSLMMFARLAALSIQDVYFGFLQQHEWIDRMAQVQMVGSFALVGSFAIGLVMTDSVMGGIAASTVVAIAAIFLLCIPVARRQSRLRPIRNGVALDWDRESIRKLLMTAAPLGLVSFLVSMQSSLPRLVLNRYTGETELGVFVALGAILAAGIALTMSVSQAVVPRLAWLRLEGDRAGFIRLLIRLLVGSFGIMVAAIIGAWLMGPTVVRIIYSSEYAEYKATLMWLAAACGVTLMGGFIGNAITVARRLSIQVINNVVALASTFGLCLILIPRYGVTGAAAAITLAGIVPLVLNVIVCIRFLNNWTVDQNETGPART